MRSASWSPPWLTVKFKRFPRGDRLKVTLYYKHAKPRTMTAAVKRDMVRIRTGRPTRAVLVAVHGHRKTGAALTIHAVA